MSLPVRCGRGGPWPLRTLPAARFHEWESGASPGARGTVPREAASCCAGAVGSGVWLLQLTVPLSANSVSSLYNYTVKFPH